MFFCTLQLHPSPSSPVPCAQSPVPFPMYNPQMRVDVKTLKQRRTLWFDNLDEALVEGQRLAAMCDNPAAPGGSEPQAQFEHAADPTPHTGVRHLGNLTLAQALGHLAIWIEYSLDGAPFTTPWYVKLYGSMLRQKMLHGPFPVGLQNPASIDEKVIPPADARLAVELKRFFEAVKRFKGATEVHPSPLLGKLTKEEWEQTHCRHAEHHFSFFLPPGVG